MANEKMKFEVRDLQAEEVLKKFGQVLRDVMPPGYGFSLLIFTFGPDGNLFYTSNANREDMIRIMQEFIAKFREN
jgi:GGDEF domain-containing protein